MALHKLFFAALMASVVMARSLPTQQHDGSSDVVRTTRKLAGLPPLDLSRVKGFGHPLGHLNFTHQHSERQTGDYEPLERRTLVGNDLELGVVSCIEPAVATSFGNDDCTRVCNSISTYTSPVMIGPLEIEEWNVGLCTFGLVNLQPCSTLELDPLSTFGDACRSMLNTCIVNGQDSIIWGAPPPLAISLYGQVPAPPYVGVLC